jgi:hypothetical protein
MILLPSQRVAGPIMRMKSFLAKAEEDCENGGNTGPLPQLSFRNDDFFEELADQVNATFQACSLASSKLPLDKRKTPLGWHFPPPTMKLPRGSSNSRGF